MYKNLSVLAVVPARGGSKGIPKKNLKKIQGKSLIEWTADVIGELSYVDAAVLSTDDPEMANEGMRVGLSVPFIRPSDLSHDSASALDTFIHAWLQSETHFKQKFDLGIWLQPSTFNRKAEHVTQACSELITNNWDAVWTLSKTDSKNHPLKQLTLNPKGKINYYDPNGKFIIARQQLETIYQQNGVAYVLRRNSITQNKTFFNENTGSVIIEEPVVSIDTPWDLQLAEWLAISSQTLYSVENN